MHAGGARGARVRGRRHGARRDRPRHGGRRRRRRRRRAAAGIEFVPGIEITAVRDGMDVHVLGYFVDRHCRRFTVSRRTAPPPPRSGAANRRAAGHVRHSSGRRRDHQARARRCGQGCGPAVDRPGAGGRPLCDQRRTRRSRWLARGRPAFIPRRAAPPRWSIAHPRIGWHRLARASGTGQAGRLAAGICRRRARRARGVPHQSRRDGDGALPEKAARLDCGLWRLGLSRRRVARIGAAGKRVAAAGGVRTVGRL